MQPKPDHIRTALAELTEGDTEGIVREIVGQFHMTRPSAAAGLEAVADSIARSIHHLEQHIADNPGYPDPRPKEMARDDIMNAQESSETVVTRGGFEEIAKQFDEVTELPKLRDQTRFISMQESTITDTQSSDFPKAKPQAIPPQIPDDTLLRRIKNAASDCRIAGSPGTRMIATLLDEVSIEILSLRQKSAHGESRLGLPDDQLLKDLHDVENWYNFRGAEGNASTIHKAIDEIRRLRERSRQVEDAASDLAFHANVTLHIIHGEERP